MDFCCGVFPRSCTASPVAIDSPDYHGQERPKSFKVRSETRESCRENVKETFLDKFCTSTFESGQGAEEVHPVVLGPTRSHTEFVSSHQSSHFTSHFKVFL